MQLKIVAVIFAVVFLVYFPSFFNQFVWDDEQFIYRNIYTTSLSYLPQMFTTNTIAGAGETSNYYRPLTTVSFTIDRLIWGLEPFGFHLTNVSLHASAAALLFILLRRLKMGNLPAAAVALIFGLHPLQTEAVTYMNSRGDSLYVFYLLIGFILFTYLCDGEKLRFKFGQWQGQLSAWALVGLAIASFIAAVLSKEIALAGLGITVVLAVIKWPQIRKANAFKKVAATLLGMIFWLVAYLLLRLTVLNFSDSLNFYAEQNVYTENIVIRLLTFCRVLFEYFRLLIWPYPLHMERSVPIDISMGLSWFWPAMAVIILVITLGFIEWRRKHTYWIWFGACWFGSFLLPVSGIVPINSLLYEHWLYMPLVGAALIMYGSISLLPIKITHQAKYLLWAGILGLLVGYSALTIRQNLLWRSPIAFYTYTLQFAESARLRNNLAMAYAEQKQDELAIEQYRRALSLDSRYPQIHYNLARSYITINQVESAKQELQTAIEISQGQFEQPYLLLIDLYRREKDYAAALPILEIMLERYPTEISFLLAKGEALFFLEQPEEAELIWQQAYQLSGRNQQVLLLIQQLQRPSQPQNQE